MVQTGFRIAILWVAPIAVSAAFGALAYRQRVPLKWPALGIILLCAFASLLNVDLVLQTPGYIGAGIGMSSGSIASQAAHMMAQTAPVLLSLAFATNRLRRRNQTLNAVHSD